jgi:hypothetical protein
LKQPGKYCQTCGIARLARGTTDAKDWARTMTRAVTPFESLDASELPRVAGGSAIAAGWSKLSSGWSKLDCVSRGQIVGTTASKLTAGGAMGIGYVLKGSPGATAGLGVVYLVDDYIATGANVAYRMINGCSDSAPSK